MKLYKVLNKDLSTIYADSQWIVGEWMPPIEGELIVCENGYHACQKKDLPEWLGESICELDYRGEIIKADNKVVVREAKISEPLKTWNEKTQRLFACDCAERALHLYEKEYPGDSRVRNCIEVARQYANGEATLQDLNAVGNAAQVAAWDAARNAVWDAAWVAARAAARAAAWDAVWAAAWDAVWVAARNAARAAEKQWQTERLFMYLDGEIN